MCSYGNPIIPPFSSVKAFIGHTLGASEGIEAVYSVLSIRHGLISFLCMFIASGSAIWSILAPIFVPMFMLLGFHPAFAQILFRIADSSVLPLAPVSPFVPLFLGFLQRYKPDAKLGTYYSLVLPYPLIFLVVWLLMLLAWYLVGLPIGPGIYPRLS